MSRGLGRLSKSRVAGAVSSSSMISLQRSMHSSQMYTPGPAMSFFTWRCDLPQKLHRSWSLLSPVPDKAVPPGTYRCAMTSSMMPYAFACSAVMK